MAIVPMFAMAQMKFATVRLQEIFEKMPETIEANKTIKESSIPPAERISLDKNDITAVMPMVTPNATEIHFQSGLIRIRFLLFLLLLFTGSLLKNDNGSR